MLVDVLEKLLLNILVNVLVNVLLREQALQLRQKEETRLSALAGAYYSKRRLQTLIRRVFLFLDRRSPERLPENCCEDSRK